MFCLYDYISGVVHGPFITRVVPSRQHEGRELLNVVYHWVGVPVFILSDKVIALLSFESAKMSIANC